MKQLNEGNYIIRLARLDDASGIAQVHVKTWRVAYKGLVEDGYLASLSVKDREMTWRERMINNQAKLQFSFVAEVNGTVVGFCVIGKSADDRAKENVGELYALYVLPEYWRKKIGTALFKKGYAKLIQLGFSIVTLWVLKGNERAIAFYSKYGFDPDGEEKDEDKNGYTLHKLRMMKS